jgi:sugar phosphate isomerase/epimerase
MRVAVHSIGWNIPRGDVFEPWLDEVVTAGYDGVAIFGLQVEDFVDNPATVARMLDERGLALAGVTAFMSDTREWAERVMEFMSALGSIHLAFTDFDTTLTIERAAEILDERGAAAKQHGVEVYYHNHTGGVGETMTEVERIIALVDPALVGVMLDVGHATKDFSELAPSERAVAFLERHWPRIRYLELKDWNEETDLNTPLGEGHADLEQVFALIAGGGYPADWLTVEQNGNDGPSRGRSSLECATRSREFLRSHGL